MSNTDPTKLSEEGKRAFEIGQFDQAADLFRQAVEEYTLGRSGLLAAEAKNNLSVALLKAGKPKEAFEAVQGTDEVFGGEKDLKRQGMALGNQAAALEGLHRYDEAIALYERAAETLKQAGEGDLRALVLKSTAALKLKMGKITESALKMVGAIEAKDKPTFFERIVRFILRIKK